MKKAFVLLAAFSSLAGVLDAQADGQGPAWHPADRGMKPWTGDLDGMAERLEQALNKKFKAGHFTVNVQFIPMSRDELIPALPARATS